MINTMKKTVKHDSVSKAVKSYMEKAKTAQDLANSTLDEIYATLNGRTLQCKPR